MVTFGWSQTKRATLGLFQQPMFGHSDQQPMFGHSDQQPMFGHSDQQPMFGHSDRYKSPQRWREDKRTPRLAG
jgi:hypothetical protein